MSLDVTLHRTQSTVSVTAQNPVDYGEFGIWSVNKEGYQEDRFHFEEQQHRRHCPLWETPWLKQFMKCVRMSKKELLQFAQCVMGPR